MNNSLRACLAILILPTFGAAEEPVVLIAPARYKKYEDKLPNYLECFRATEDGKRAGMKVMYGTAVGDAFAKKTTKVVVVLNEVRFANSPRKFDFAAFGPPKRGSADYKVYYRPDPKQKHQELVKGTVWTDHANPTVFDDGYAAHLNLLKEGLDDEIGRALFAQVMREAPKDVRDGDRNGFMGNAGGTFAGKAYPTERFKDGKDDVLKYTLDSKLPLPAGYESLEVINKVTGKQVGIVGRKDKSAIIVEPKKLLALDATIPKDFPKEDYMIRAHRFFVVIGE